MRKIIEALHTWRARAREALALVDDFGPTFHTLMDRLTRALEAVARQQAEIERLTAEVADGAQREQQLREEVFEHEDRQARVWQLGEVMRGMLSVESENDLAKGYDRACRDFLGDFSDVLEPPAAVHDGKGGAT